MEHMSDIIKKVQESNKMIDIPPIDFQTQQSSQQPFNQDIFFNLGQTPTGKSKNLNINDILIKDKEDSPVGLDFNNVDFNKIDFNNTLLNVDLQDSQKEAVTSLLQNKKSILTTETGLGKSYILLSLISLLWDKCKEEDKIMILNVPNNKLIDFKNLIYQTMPTRKYNFRVVTGESAVINTFLENTKFINLIITTPVTYRLSMDFNIWCFNNKDRLLLYCHDEASGDGETSAGYNFTVNLSRYAEYSVMANATPVSSKSGYTGSNINELKPIYYLLYSINALSTDFKYTTFCNKYADVKYSSNSLPKMTPYYDKIFKEFSDKIVNTNREDLGIDTKFKHIKFHKTNLSEKQENIISRKQYDKLFQVLYSPKGIDSLSFDLTFPPVKVLLYNILPNLSQETNKIIYCSNVYSTNALHDLLNSIGLKTYILNGDSTSSNEAKQELLDKFNLEKGSILITNIIEGVNIGSATNIICYNIPPDLLQLTARATRGFSKSTITLDMIYYDFIDKSYLEGILKQLKAVTGLTNRTHDELEYAIKEELKTQSETYVSKSTSLDSGKVSLTINDLIMGRQE